MLLNMHDKCTKLQLPGCSLTRRNDFLKIITFRQSLTKVLDPSPKNRIFAPLPPVSMLIVVPKLFFDAHPSKEWIHNTTNIEMGGEGEKLPKNIDFRRGPTLLWEIVWMQVFGIVTFIHFYTIYSGRCVMKVLFVRREGLSHAFTILMTMSNVPDIRTRLLILVQFWYNCRIILVPAVGET